jgi:2'-5' RNA ligase
MANWFIATVPHDTSWFERVPNPPCGFHRFAPDDLHVTVAFLGPCGEAPARVAWVAIREAWSGGAIAAALDGVVPMGDPRRYSALSATFSSGHERLAALLELLRDPAADAAGAPRERRSPLPHMTLARTPRHCEASLRNAGLAWAQRIDLRSVHVLFDTLALFTRAPASEPQRLFHPVERTRF